jgi:hypothetical protein
MWKERVGAVCAACAFGPPAGEAALFEAEKQLEVEFPTELRALLLEMDGVQDEYGSGILSCEEIVTRNLEMREDFASDESYMPFDHLLFFAEDGGGSLHFYPVQSNGRINRPFIFEWDHETDSRTFVAANLEQFIVARFGEADQD